PGILLPIELDDLCVEDLAVVKFHPLPERDLQGPVIQPAPAGRQPRHHLAMFVDLHEVLEDVPRQPCPVARVLIDNAEVSAWGWDLCPHAALTPPKGDEQENEAANDELLHGDPSFRALCSHNRGMLPSRLRETRAPNALARPAPHLNCS